LMTKAAFNSVFIGIETPNEESLLECNKLQNKNRDLLTCVKKIQQFGLQVQGGFILGFDNDNATIFNKLVNFIQESGIATAMVGLLNAPRGTKLHQRLAVEGRLLNDMSGDNTDLTMNFIPKMDRETLTKGYQQTINAIYAPKNYYQRVRTFLKEYSRAPRGPKKPGGSHLQFNEVMAFLKSTVRLGIIGRERVHYWKLVFWSLFRCPRQFPMAITLSIYGFHFRKIFANY
ncbi:MAG TPA: DUF4070 domain-containing protein, partial [Bacillota bacterium]|nr:DUF4070 domain-containing protein [Bacillota bacterium]